MLKPPNYPDDTYNKPSEYEIPSTPKIGSIDQIMQAQALQVLSEEMGDNEALDPRKMSERELKAQGEWVAFTVRNEAEATFAHAHANPDGALAPSPEEVLILRESESDPDKK